MHGFRWSESEKKLARRVYEAALEQELAETMAVFQARAAGAKEPDDIWDIEKWLTERRRDIDYKYDYRYSQLVTLFGWLMGENRITREQLAGLAEDKLALIMHIDEARRENDARQSGSGVK